MDIDLKPVDLLCCRKKRGLPGLSVSALGDFRATDPARNGWKHLGVAEIDRRLLHYGFARRVVCGSDAEAA